MATKASAKGYELIITEKPSTAEKIAGALADGKPVRQRDEKVSFYELTHKGKDIVVASAVGHLFTVAEKEKSYKYPSYDVEWKLTADVEKGAAFSRKYAQIIKRLAKDAKEFTVATDYDIEGETIGLNIVKYLANQKDAHRMKFSTVTADDLRDAYENKSPRLDWGQAHAGVTRHVLDWLYGINVSRALTTSVKTAGSFMVLSTGRVQGPALRIVAERERDIQAFVPEDYWQLTILGKKDEKPWEAMHEKDRFDDESEAKAIVAKCKGNDAIVDTIDSRTYNQSAPTPFDLGGLQTEAYRAFGIKPKDTLAIAQNLYTNAYISYPRTSSQKLPSKIGYRKILMSLAKQDHYKSQTAFLLDKGLLTPNEGKKDDPAHPAIYPTGVEPREMNPREEKVYDLIVKRFFATFGEAAIRQTDTVSIVIAGEKFLCKGTRTTKAGWHELYTPYVDLKEEELPDFKPKEKLAHTGPKSTQKQTQPPKRYTPSSLVNELEKRGLGTKATRADIVESLIKRNYVKGNKSFEVTELGMKIFEILEKRVPEIVDEALTRHFEEELEQIREDEKQSEEVLAEARTELDRILAKFQKNEQATGEDLIEARKIEQDTVNTLFECPKCKKGNLRIMYSKKTRRRFIGCSSYPECDAIFSLPAGEISVATKQCEACSWDMLEARRKGARPNLVCINPECPTKLELQAEQQKLAKSAGEGNPCPKCGKGKLVQKSGRFGLFLSCDQYPKCKTIVNIPKSKEELAMRERAEKHAGGPCPKCGEGKLQVKKGPRGLFLGCDQYPKCKTIVNVPEE